MSGLVLMLLLSATVFCDDVPNLKETAREEKLRSALIDAFQNIKKASAKGGIDDESPLTSDLIGSISLPSLRDTSTDKSSDDSFDLFTDEDGLTFDEAFEDVQETKPKPVTSEKSHNVQHIIKSDRTVPDSNRDTVLKKITDSIRNTLNESRQVHLVKEAVHNSSEYRSIDTILRVFDADILVTQWSDLQTQVVGQCRDEIQMYVNGLQDRKLWALKMDDAGGRYESMFFWGNNYWIGSPDLCQSLNDQNPHVQKTNKSAASQIFSEWRSDVSMSGDVAPFYTAFYTVRLTITSHEVNVAKKRRSIHLGVCLPYSCTRGDISRLVSAARSPLEHQVVAVRAPTHHEYYYSQDSTFKMLVGATTIVTILLIAATVYDMKLSRAVRKRRQRAENMSRTSAETGTKDGADMKLDLNSLNAITVTNGKSMYSVNNNINSSSSSHSDEQLTAETISNNEEELKLSVWSELLLSFSMKANILQIFDHSVGSDTVPVIHGLRFFSMVWVIFGHTCIVVFKYADNTALRIQLEKSFWFQLIISAVYSVDTFFCLGGMLVTFLYFRTNAKGKLDVLTKGRHKFTSGVLQFLGLVGYRFARLTAPYLMMIGVAEVTMKWFAENAVFEPPANDHETCPKYWWRNLLYINTLFPVEQMCMLSSWYLSDDTQFYAVSAILLILSTSHFKLSAVLYGIFFVSSLLTTGYVSWSSHHIPTGDDPFTSFDKIYDKPWTRLGPYLVGMITGWLLFKTNLRIPMNRLWATVGWLSCCLCLLFLIFGLYSVELGVVSAAVYSALSHTLWAAAIGWVIVACTAGYGGWVRRILSAPVLYPMSRVTYCAYLVHPVALRVLAMNLTHPIHLGELFVFVIFLGMTVISYFLAFVLSVAFEAPVVTMLKILSPQRKPHRV